MRLLEYRDLRCRVCEKHPGPLFLVLRWSQAFVSPKAARGVLGLATLLGGALGIAESLAPDPEVAKVAGEEDPSLWFQAVLCQACAYAPDTSLPAVMVEEEEPTAAPAVEG